MVGNDVVDFGDREAAAARLNPRFDTRVFTADERSWIAAGRVLVERWRLWAAKEAAYKVARRRESDTVWSPVRFVVEPGTDDGLVRHGGDVYHVEWQTTEDWVHAVAWFSGDRPANWISEVAPMAGEDASAAARALACKAVRDELDVGAGDPRVVTEERIPTLVAGANRWPLSLSHHGRFVAFACALPTRESLGTAA